MLSMYVMTFPLLEMFPLLLLWFSQGLSESLKSPVYFQILVQSLHIYLVHGLFPSFFTGTCELADQFQGFGFYDTSSRCLLKMPLDLS